MELENWNYISLKTSIVCLLIKIDQKRSEGFRQQLDQFGIFKKILLKTSISYSTCFLYFGLIYQIWNSLFTIFSINI